LYNIEYSNRKSFGPNYSFLVMRSMKICRAKVKNKDVLL